MNLSQLLDLKEEIDDLFLAISLIGILLLVYVGAMSAPDATAAIVSWIPGILVGGLLDVLIFKIVRPFERLLS